MLEKNGYPTGFLNQQIRIFFNKMHEKVKTPEVEEKLDSESKTRPIFSIVKLPYIGDMSHQIEKEIRQYLFKKLSPKIKICYGTRNNNYWPKIQVQGPSNTATQLRSSV